MSRRVIMPVFLGGGDTPTSNYAVNLSMTMDSNYIISAQLIDQDGNYLGTEQTIDLPIESTVVNGTYDSNTKSIILTLNNGNTITIPVADLVSGLQPTIDANNKLNADYISDGTTNKVFTASDKQSLMDAISATSNLGTMAYQDASNYTPSASLSSVATSGSYNDLVNKPTIPTSTSQLTNDSGYITGITSSDVTTALGYTPGTSNFSGSYNDLTNKPDLSIYAQSASLSTVATSGSYNDLTNKPTIPTATSDLTNDSGFITGITSTDVTTALGYTPGTSNFSGSYNDLTDKPTLGTMAAEDASNYTPTSSLASVATSGSYNDLSNTPTIPTVNDATITLTQGGVTKGTFTLNQSSNATIDFGQGMSSVDWSDINNKPNFATVATSGDYDDLTDKPTLGTMAAESASDYTPTASLGSMAFANTSDYTTTSSLAAVATSGDYLDLSNTPSLATVATSGSYNDLSNKPTIPAAQVNSDWTANSGVSQILNKPNLATVATSGSYTDLSNTPSLATVATSGSYTDLSNLPTIPTIPTNVSAFTNDANYATESYVTTAISNIPSPMIFKGSLGTGGTITTLPAASSANEGFTYKVIKDGTYDSQSAKVGDMFISDGTNWVYIPSADEPSGTVTSVGLTVPTGLSVSGSPITSSGTLAISLESGYSIPTTTKQSEWDAKSNFSGSYTDLTNKPDLSIYAQSANLASVATSGSYNDLTNTPTIPAAQVNADWDAVSGVSQILNKPTLSTVATSGSYNDLSNKPTIPTKVSDLTNDSGFITGITSSDVTTALGYTPGTSSFSGSYTDLTDKPTIPAAQVNSDWSASSGVAQILNKPDLSIYAQSANLATVATSGSYNDLSNKPSIPAAQVNADWDAVSGVSQILNKPTLATVATSGSYADLSNKPTIPAAQIQSDWTQTTTTALDYIKNKPNLATVATSGSYNDLSNKPTIPSAANNAKLNIQRNTDTAVQVFSANESTNKTINFAAGGGMTLSQDTTTANTYKLTIAHATPSGAATKTSGFYKFSTDARGHVNGTTAVGTSDISALLSSQTLTFVDGQGNTTTITFYTTA